MLRRSTVNFFLASLAFTALLCGQDRRDVSGEFGVVASSSPDASDLGAAIMEQGGNAVDAAIATAFAMAVTHPTAGNIGGGGFMLIYPADGSPPVFIDYREKAPLSSTPDMYAEGGSRKNHRYVGVPGTVRGLALAHEIYGNLSWKQLVEPAVKLAAEGFTMNEGLARSLNGALRSSSNEEFMRVYGKEEGTAWQAGDRLLLSDLAATLQRIADHGRDGFYKGKTAELLAAEMERGGGYVTMEDLARYRARVRVPIRFSYRGYEIFSAPPPSSGGITLAQMLQILEHYDLRQLGRWSAETNHLIIEAMRRGYANRAQYLGDTDFIDIPDFLTTKEFAKELKESIDPAKATPSEKLGPQIAMAGESRETTHFSVVDRQGMAVSNTYTLEAGYGSGVVVTGAGFLLNNEMGDFNPKPGITNTRGTIGTPPNLIVPEKRMLSSMTPTIVAKAGRPYLVTGSPGGRTIINTVLCVVINVLDFEMDLRDAIDAPRTDHEWFPERVRFMGASDPAHAELVEDLKNLGHDLQPSRGQGDANSIIVEGNGARATADSRWGGAAAAKK
ncbi:MAG: gamma-glutamyltransferase [Planctomycetota bacterium]|jgi:gamma-glutamyltranspeptidase/glutathione hydrolase